jgi:hypothetical protein
MFPMQLNFVVHICGGMLQNSWIAIDMWPDQISRVGRLFYFSQMNERLIVPEFL